MGGGGWEGVGVEMVGGWGGAGRQGKGREGEGESWGKAGGVAGIEMRVPPPPPPTDSTCFYHRRTPGTHSIWHPFKYLTFTILNF